MSRLARIAVLALAAALALAGCEKEHTVTEAKTEGIWVDVGELDYHIQGSRQLTEAIVPDDAYLTGLPTGVLPPEADETYFAVFVRIENRSDETQPTAEEFEIVDTDEKVFRPLKLDPEANAFAYVPTELPSRSALPAPDSAAELDSTAGALLLFKIPLDSYQNRPLELKIRSDANEATIDLDV